MHARLIVSIEANCIKPTPSSVLACSWSLELHAHKVRYQALLLDCIMGCKNVVYTKRLNHLNDKLKC